MTRNARALRVFAAGLLLVCAFGAAHAEPWKFAVMSDTQWKTGRPDAACPLGDTNNCDGKNPNTVAVGIINELNQQFIAQGVKFVIQLGDLTDNGSNIALDTRATFAQALYNAGIGFYPLRGNHESSRAAALEFQRIFPQTQTGSNNQTPANAFVTTPAYPVKPAVVGGPFTVGSDFASYSDGYKGLFYAFTYGGARFVLIDQFSPAIGSSHSDLDGTQVNWIAGQLQNRTADHAFVFGHKGFITENHADILFGGNPAVQPALQNTLLGAMYASGVRYYLGGHDHMHNRAIVTSPDGTSFVQNIIASSNSYKFYVPQVPSNDTRYDNPTRETQLQQELFTIGYYVFTVDGPRVTAEYWATPNGCNGDCDLTRMPASLNFTRRETWGYSLNGREFRVPEGESYGRVMDEFNGLHAAILWGTNGSASSDYAGRNFTKLVDTGWTRGTLGSVINHETTTTDILTLWGMGKDLGSDRTDTYALSIGLPDVEMSNKLPFEATLGTFGLVTRGENGRWINAVNRNSPGSVKSFVYGPYQEGYGLGTYGLDPETGSAWAVLDYNADFAIGWFAE